MFSKSKLSAAISTALISGSSVNFAQTDESPDIDVLYEEVLILGTRREERSATNTAAPVDFVGAKELERVDSKDMDSMLRSLVPSYNVTQQPQGDEASFIRPANMRGLPPDHTLIFVNGKRRHRGAIIAFLGEGVADGAQGADVSAIPGIALKQLQVLRDGAAAQYGADAIAGVLNFQLKDDRQGGTLEIGSGEFSDGDGDTYTLAGNLGLPLTDSGFLNLSLEYSEADKTSRTVQEADAATLAAAGNTAIPNPALTWGNPEVSKNIKFFANSGIALNEHAKLYGFGNYASKKVVSVFFWRNPNGRDGVYSNDEGATLLVADLDTSNAISCPTITITDNVPDQAALNSISAGGALDEECFAFNEVLPGGFTPRFGGEVLDLSAAFGIRGKLSSGWNYDVSANWGRSAVDYSMKNSLNASFGPDTPFEFDIGENIESDTNFNIDLSYGLPVSIFYSDLNIAFGFEWREEEFQVKLGEPASYLAGDLIEQGFSSGSNGYAGYGPSSEGTFSRKNSAIYIDLETDMTEKLLLGMAVRWEDYNTFGATTKGKLSARYDFNDTFALRSTLSTGFRAPTAGQSNIIRTVTEMRQDPVTGVFSLQETSIFPATHPIASRFIAAENLGGGELEPEDSTNFGLGVVFTIGNVDFTLDYFHIKVENRIALSSLIQVDTSNPEHAAIIDELTSAGIPGATTVDSFQFFTNDFTTITKGFDLVASSAPMNLGEGKIHLSLTLSHATTELEKITPLVDEFRKIQLEEGLPKTRWILTGTHSQGPWNFLARVSYYDEYTIAFDQITATASDSFSFDGVYGDEILVDAEATYAFQNNLTLTLGAANLLDEYPDKVSDLSRYNGRIYPYQSPFGFNGAYYYLETRYTF